MMDLTAVPINNNEWMVTTAKESVLWILLHPAGCEGEATTYYVHDHIEGELLGTIAPEVGNQWRFIPDVHDLLASQMQAICVFMKFLEEKQNGT